MNLFTHPKKKQTGQIGQPASKADSLLPPEPLAALRQLIAPMRERMKRYDEAIQALVAASTHAIVFTRGEDATIQQLRSRLHESRIPTRTILLDKDGRPLPKQTQSSRSGSRS